MPLLPDEFELPDFREWIGNPLRSGGVPPVPLRLSRLEQRLQKLCEDARCRGLLSEAYSPLAAAVKTSNGLPRRLVPVGRVLIELSYHDVALECMELAGEFDPTPEQQFARAYLLALLGDTEESWRAYSDGHSRFGPVSEAELDALALLARTHPEEEDLVELFELVRGLAAG
ncbi:MAG: hypothetical protein M3R04_00070 [bacterium]|nr:hypothetical protein [bacterium]